MTVTSGTYVRSIVHDIATALGTTAHVVKLTRTRQGEFVLHPPAASTLVTATTATANGTSESAPEQAQVKPEELEQGVEDGTASDTVVAGDGLKLDTFSSGCVEWTLLERAIAALKSSRSKGAGAASEGSGQEEEGDADGWLEWEREILSKCQEV